MATPPTPTPTSTPTPTPTPTPTKDQHEPHLHIKSAARKLPIKRPPNPTPPTPVSGSSPDSDSNSDSVPLKFHRIWSEADEVRFLQGLLACRSQPLVFPRDLNIFFDRFSETMQQPYTRSQLSEKLRRLRKKFRVVSSRVSRGLNPATALTQHDRDLYHLSTQLWHPSYADSSPFAASGPEASKRRRRFPPPPLPQSHLLGSPPTDVRYSPVTIAALPSPAVNAANADALESKDVDKVDRINRVKVEEPAGKDGTEKSVRRRVAKSVLDVFDESVKETKTGLVRNGEVSSDLERRWTEQRVMELDVLARRMRLVIENAIPS